LDRLIEHDELVVETFFFFTMLDKACFVLLNGLFQGFVFAFQLKYLLLLLKQLFVLFAL
jgi:hypothetical protein